MADSQKESVNRQVITFFVAFTLTLYQMNTFYAILSV